MTEQERQEAFIQALRTAEEQYGYTVVSTIYVEGLGPVQTLGQAHIKPGPISIIPIEGWQSSQGKIAD